MKLSELEERARQEREERAALAAEEEHREQLAEAEAAEEFRQEVIKWMVEEGCLNYEELQATLSVVDKQYQRVILSVPEHTDIVFQVTKQDGEIVGMYNDRFEVLGFDGGYHYDYAHNLGAALFWAAEKYQEGMEREAEQTAWEAERERRHKVQEAEAIARGEEYLALLDANPILLPILDILRIFLEERERLEDDLAQAEEFYAGVEGRYKEKLDQAQHEADCHSRERDDLQRDLWDQQAKIEKLEREVRRQSRGW